MNCPICQAELIKANFAICQYWECKKEICIDGLNIVHYRKKFYNDGMTQYRYILPPFYAISDGHATSLTLLKDANLGFDIKKYITDKTICVSKSTPLDESNSETVLNKLKLYNIFS